MKEGALAGLMTFLAALATVAAFAASCPVAAADYPDRPITLIVPLPPGGTNDILARAVADKMSASLGQRIVVESRNAGGSGTVGTREFVHAPPDGYTILLGYTSTLATGPSVRNVGYDPRKDFAPLGLIASAPALLLVHKDLAAHNVGELIALMKSSKEPYQVGTPGVGTVNYLACVLFAQQAGVKVEQIPYKGTNALITDMIGGFVKVGIAPIPVSRAALDGGYIRALAVTTGKHSTLMPELPTLAEFGPARLRRAVELWAAGARRHSETDHRTLEQGIARGARDRGGAQAHHPGGRRTGADHARTACGHHRPGGDQMVDADPRDRIESRVRITPRRESPA